MYWAIKEYNEYYKDKPKNYCEKCKWSKLICEILTCRFPSNLINPDTPINTPQELNEDNKCYLFDSKLQYCSQCRQKIKNNNKITKATDNKRIWVSYGELYAQGACREELDWCCKNFTYFEDNVRVGVQYFYDKLKEYKISWALWFVSEFGKFKDFIK